MPKENNDDGYSKFKPTDSKALKARKELLEALDHNKEYFAINLNIYAFKSTIYLFPGISIRLNICKTKYAYFVDILKTDSRPNKKIQIDIQALVKL